MFPFGIQLPPQPTRPRPAEPYPRPLEPTPNPLPHPQLENPDHYLIDVIDKEKGYIVIFEVPATSAEAIQTHIAGRRIHLSINGKLFRELELPVEVELEEQHFKNGVIELQLKHL
jgi:HSP20 family molecular chaperone IbpA